MRTITNDYRDAQILNLGSGGERGPYLVTQNGVAPRAALPKTRMSRHIPDYFCVVYCRLRPASIRRRGTHN